ncbi:MAG: hypothetical protein J5449_09940 [Oscillospiraceae bacterium]|nr:hypothetical protein [Oscillospiraceae bacterium]
MINRNGKHIMRITAALLSAFALFGLGGCQGGRQNEPEPIAGGVTDKTDRGAPKTIVSKDIAELYATFCLEGEWSPGRRTSFYTFSVKPDDVGTLTASESVAGVGAPADKALLTALQEIVDRYGLAGQNGEHHTTAGLPPEFGPCTLSVHYASGEKLTFTYDNDPDAAWAKEMYLAFADWFASKGIDALLPPETVTGTVTDVHVFLRDDGSGKLCDYGIWSEPDDEGRRVIFRCIGDEETELPLADEQAFLAGVERIMKSYDLRRYDTRSALYGYEQTEEDRNGPFSNDMELVFWFGKDEQLFIHTSAQSEIDALRPLLDELLSYFNSYFDAS